MNIGVIPAEIWLMIFEIDLPGEICIVRQRYAAYIRQVCRDYDAGNQGPVSRLLAYERSQWAHMRRFYNLNQALRRIAQGTGLQERWLSSVNDLGSSPEIPHLQVPRRSMRNSSSLHIFFASYQACFCGRGSSRYTALDLYWRRSDLDRPADLRWNGLHTQQLLECARSQAIFNNLTKLDLIVDVPPVDRSEVQVGVNKLVCCIVEQWKRFGVKNGVVRVIWEV